MDCLVRGFGAFDDLLARLSAQVLATFQRGRQTLAGILDFISRHMGSSGEQCSRVFRERVGFTSVSLNLFFHIFSFFGTYYLVIIANPRR